MKETTVRNLRHQFGNVMVWIEDGENVQIKKRGRVIAMLTPVPSDRRRKKRNATDFMARLKSRDGDHVIPAKDIQKVLHDNKGDY